MALIYCRECGAQVSDQAASCPKCGCPMNVAAAVERKSRSMAVLLALLLGGLGMHKFYLSRPGAGVLYPIFCWTFLPAIVGFIEGLMYLSMSEEAFQKLAAKR